MDGNLNPASFATAAQGAKADGSLQLERIFTTSATPTGAKEGDIWIKP